MTRTVTVARQWSWPVALALLTVVGLAAALFGEGGAWWYISWIALTMPLVIALRHWLRPASGEKVK